MTANSFALKGNIVYSQSPRELSCTEDGYVVCEEGLCAGVFAELPPRFAHIHVRDFSGQMIIPGLIDLHTHAPQYPNRALGMDLELLDWLNTYTFPEESRYHDLDYARRAYAGFVHALVHGATTRAAIFATLHLPATLLLMELLEASGLITLVGKVNMDRNSIDSLTEPGARASLDTTEEWLRATGEKGFDRTAPILTPRFVPTCSDELLAGLGRLQEKWSLPVQSHLSENPSEIAWVRKLCPDAKSYADAYLRFGLLGGPSCPTIMAHCVYLDPLETSLLKERGAWIAHCPLSNTCLASGIAPVRSFFDQGLRVGLGTDVAGGYSLSMLHTIAEAIKASKLRWRLVDESLAPLSVAEAFYLATKGGGSFWGKVGSFEEGFDFDAVVLEDIGSTPGTPDTPTVPDTPPAPTASQQPTDSGLTLENRLERLIYADANDRVLGKYVAGRRIL